MNHFLECIGKLSIWTSFKVKSNTLLRNKYPN